MPLPSTNSNLVCLGTLSIKENIVEIWCDKLQVEPPFIKINGIVCAKNHELPINISDKVEFMGDDVCFGGALLITNNKTPPVLLNIQDMIDNRTTVNRSEKYFNDFEINRYCVYVTNEFKNL